MTITRHPALPPWQLVRGLCTRAVLTWPLAGSFLQLPHWLSLAQEALQEWESSIELKRNQKRDIADFFVREYQHGWADRNTCRDLQEELPSPDVY